MAGGPWLVVVVVVAWTCLAGRLCSGLRETDEKHFDHQFDTNYVAMKKAASGINIPNPDMVVIYGTEALGLCYAFTQRLSSFSHVLYPKTATKVYASVMSGECVPPSSRARSDECLTQRDARVLMFQEGREVFYSAAAFITEAGVRARLQWFKENGVDDVVSIVSADAQNLFGDALLAIHGPVRNLWRQVGKFSSIMQSRYASGTGSAEDMVSAADAVARDVYAIWGVVISKQLPALKFYYSTQKRAEQYSAMFLDHLESVTVTATPHRGTHRDSPHAVIRRYWDARALEYAITWIFKMRKEVGVSDRNDIDKALDELYTGLVTGQTKACLDTAAHVLSKTMDRLGHRILGKYLEHPMQNEIDGLYVPVPPNLEDLNPVGVPRSLEEAENWPSESTINHYFERLEGQSLGQVVFSRIASLL